MSDSPPSAPGDPPPKHDYVEDDFSWLVEEETAGAKLSRKMKENPFVPIGEVRASCVGNQWVRLTRVFLKINIIATTRSHGVIL